jgi:DNA polymerase-3 subunit beta
MQPIARVNPKYFAAMSVFMAVRDVRYYLEGVFIEPHPEKGVIMVATDGHTLGLIHDPDGWVAAPIIVGGISKKLISACSTAGVEHRMTVPKLLYISQMGAVVTGDANIFAEVNPFAMLSLHMSKIEIIDAKYPDWRKVVCLKREAGESFPCVNAVYLARLASVAKLLIPNHKYGQGVEMFFGERNTSVVARFTTHDLEQRFVGLLMPMHNEAPKKQLPDWLMPTEEPAAAEPKLIETPNAEVFPC